jgi:hypothetical protein
MIIVFYWVIFCLTLPNKNGDDYELHKTINNDLAYVPVTDIGCQYEAIQVLYSNTYTSERKGL